MHLQKSLCKEVKYCQVKLKLQMNSIVFFLNVGPNLANNIRTLSNSHVYDFMKDKSEKSMFVEDVTTNEIIKIVNSFKNKSSCDVNGISMYILKNVFIAVVQPFKYICNLSLNKGVFPDDMKIARVIPLYKGQSWGFTSHSTARIPLYKAGDKNVFTNYRPVSILPQFSKTLEKVFNNRLDNFLEKDNVIADSQYGFHRNRSTSMALIELIEKIKSLDDKKTL